MEGVSTVHQSPVLTTEEINVPGTSHPVSPCEGQAMVSIAAGEAKDLHMKAVQMTKNITGRKLERLQGVWRDNNFGTMLYTQAALNQILKRVSPEKDIRFSSTRLDCQYHKNPSLFHKAIENYESKSTEEKRRYILGATEVSQHDGTIYPALEGQDQLSAKRNLQAGELLGQYVGTLMSNDELEQSGASQTVADLIDDYSVQLPNKLTLNGLVSNQMHCINDGSLPDITGRKDKSRENAELVVVHRPVETGDRSVRMPYVYVFANRAIKKGDTVWISYGEHYWQDKIKRMINRPMVKLANHHSLDRYNSDVLSKMGQLLHSHLVERKSFSKAMNDTFTFPYSEAHIVDIFHNTLFSLQLLCFEDNKTQTDNDPLQSLAKQLGIEDLSKIAIYLEAYRKRTTKNYRARLIFNEIIHNNPESIRRISKQTHVGQNIIYDVLIRYLKFIEKHEPLLTAKQYKIAINTVKRLLEKKDKIISLLKGYNKSGIESLSNPDSNSVTNNPDILCHMSYLMHEHLTLEKPITDCIKELRLPYSDIFIKKVYSEAMFQLQSAYSDAQKEKAASSSDEPQHCQPLIALATQFRNQ